jgi:hypothetical protein
LCVALETIRQPEPLPRQSIENPLAQMAEWRMAKIMSSGCRLYYNMIKTSKFLKQSLILCAKQSHSDCSSDSRHLDRVGEPVVHDSAGCRRGDHLRDLGEPR